MGESKGFIILLQVALLLNKRHVVSGAENIVPENYIVTLLHHRTVDERKNNSVTGRQLSAGRHLD
jgi:hypothetical protein